MFTNAVFEGDGRMEQGFLETFWQSTVVIKCTEHSSTGIALLIAPTHCGAGMTKMYSKQVNASANASLGYLGNVAAIISLLIMFQFTNV